jgi:hypothetical protein
LVRQQERDLRLTTLLAGAMAQAMAALVQDGDYAGTEDPQALAGGKYEISSRREGSNRVYVRLRVVYGGAGRGASAVLELYPVLRVQSWQIEPSVQEPQL